MIIDFHTHVMPLRIKQDRRRYAERDKAFAEIYSDEKARIVAADELIESMDRDGVDISVIVNYGWSTHGLCVETNDYILESVARFPERLIGFCAVSSYNDDISLAEIERCAGAGARGVGELRPDIQPPDYTDAEAIKPFVEILQKHHLIVMTHASEPVGHSYPGKGTATPELLYPFITGLSDLPVVCAHWGGGLPFFSLMPEVQEALGNVYYDTAASPFLYRPEIYRYVSGLVGAGRILFGSDYPLMPARRLVQEIDTAGLSEAEKERILAGNARRLMNI